MGIMQPQPRVSKTISASDHCCVMNLLTACPMPMDTSRSIQWGWRWGGPWEEASIFWEEQMASAFPWQLQLHLFRNCCKVPIFIMQSTENLSVENHISS